MQILQIPMMAGLLAGTILTVAPFAASPRAVAPEPVRIAMAATVGGVPFACGQSFAGIGTTQSTITVSDFRFFVSGVAMVDAAGAATPLTLTEDGKWQHGDVALVDFEDGTGTCANGTPDTRAVIEGTVPAGAYTGVRFDIGLPFDVNHKDVTLQPSPLNLSRLFWNWNGGYKFARIDMKTTGRPQGWVLHLGSTDCTPGGGPNVVPVSCAHENKPRVTLSPFDPATQIAQFDLAALLAGSNVDVNQADTAAGCMSAGNDADCAGMFAALGLPFGGKAAPGQTVFTAIKAGR